MKYNIGKKTINLFDKQRRKYVLISIYYPTNEISDKINLFPIWNCEKVSPEAEIIKKKGKFPLVILSHGNGGSGANLTWISDYLVNRGYICINLDHQEEIHDYNDMSHIEYWNRPADINFVINSTKKIKFFKTNIDFERVGIIGFSLGGLTTAWLLGAEIKNNLKIPKRKLTKSFEYPKGFDQRKLDEVEIKNFYKKLSNSIFKCGVMIAPARGFPNSWGGSEQQKLIYGKYEKPDINKGMIFDNEGIRKIKKPILLIKSDKDEIVENETNVDIYHKNIKNSILKEVRGNHYVFLNRFHKIAKEYFDDYLYKKHQGKDKAILTEQKKTLKYINDFLTKTI